MHRGFRGVREKPERPADPAVRRANLHRIARLFTRVPRPPVGRARPHPRVGGPRRRAGVPAARRPAGDRRARHEQALVLRGRDDRDRDRDRSARRVADAALEPGGAARDARPAHRSLPPPAAPVARVLHAHTHRRGAVAHLERHRRRAERRHEHGDVDRLERDHGARGDDRDDRALLGAVAVRVRAGPGVRAPDAPRRRRAAEDREVDAGDARRHLEPRPGVAFGIGCPARKDDGPLRRARGPLRGRIAAARRPRGAPADGRPLDDGDDPDHVRRHARRGLLVRRARARARLARGLGADARRVHDPADATLLPGRLAARCRARRADVARALRPDLRLPRPARRHRGAAGREDARRRPATSCSTASGSATASDAWTLRDVSFTVPAGSKTALVGETGSGKTTLGYLAARLYDVDQGSDLDRRRRPARPDLRLAGIARRRRLAGDLPLPRLGARQPALREARRDRRRARSPPPTRRRSTS